MCYPCGGNINFIIEVYGRKKSSQNPNQKEEKTKNEKTLDEKNPEPSSESENAGGYGFRFPGPSFEDTVREYDKKRRERGENRLGSTHIENYINVNPQNPARPQENQTANSSSSKRRNPKGEVPLEKESANIYMIIAVSVGTLLLLSKIWGK